MRVQNLSSAYQEFPKCDGFIACIFFVELKGSIDIIISDLTSLY